MSKAESWGRRLLVGLALGAALGAAAAYGLVSLLGRAWSTCDVGINPSANSFALLALLPIVWLVDVAAFAIAFAVVFRGGRLSAAIATLAGLLALAVTGWVVFAWVGTPAGYPAPACPDNVPPWWPGWLPA